MKYGIGVGSDGMEWIRAMNTGSKQTLTFAILAKQLSRSSMSPRVSRRRLCKLLTPPRYEIRTLLIGVGTGGALRKKVMVAGMSSGKLAWD